MLSSPVFFRVCTFLTSFELFRTDQVDASVSEKHTLSIFRGEVAMLGSGGIYIGLEEGKVERMGHFSSEDGDSMFL
jgi:hypothetical protein